MLHLPCSHVMAACADLVNHRPEQYVSHYFTKETICRTWQYEINGFRLVGTFTETADQVFYIPDPRTRRVKRGRRQTRRIRNDMDESELRGNIVSRCSSCNQTGHTYNRCPNNQAGPSSAEVGPAGDATDGRAPVTSTRVRRRRSSASATSSII